MEATVVKVVNPAQTASLIKPLDKTVLSRQLMKTLVHVLYLSLTFKARATSAANVYDHHGSSNATKSKPDTAEASDDLIVSSQTITNEMNVNRLHHISRIVQEKKLLALQAYGGLSAVAGALNTDLDTGLSENEAIHRNMQHGSSHSLPSACKFPYLVLEALNDKTILLLLLAANLSLIFGIIEEGKENGWQDGVILLITTAIMVLFTSSCNYQQERRAQKKLEKQLSMEGRLAKIDVIRGGEAKRICKSKLVRGDVVLLKKGRQVPADGLFVAGQALEVDDGSESYMIDELNPFLSYGDRIINGDARMVMTSVDMNSGWREMMSKDKSSDSKFSLEAQLDKLNICIHITGFIVCILISIALFLHHIFGKKNDNNGYEQEYSGEEPTAMRAFADCFERIFRESKYTPRALIKLLSVSLVGVTQGVPFVVSVAIRYYNHKTLSGKATNQDSLAVVNMALITVICMGMFVDEMEVDKLFIGAEVINGSGMLSSDVVEVLCDGIGTSMEKAVVHWAKETLGFRRERMIQRWKILNRRGTNPFEEPCHVLMLGAAKSDEMFLHLNGPVKEILNMCTHYYDSKGNKACMSDRVTQIFNQANKEMQHKQLRTIAFACKRTNTQTLDANDLVLVALLGLKSRSMEVTKAEVKKCKEHGIKTIMVSSKRVSVLQDIALRCGVMTDGDSESLVTTGEAFRKLTNKKRLETVDKICVLGEALPDDKLLLVETLRKKGEVVAFLGQRTDEAPTLRGADIGIAMGRWISKKVRESSDIIVTDGSLGDLISMVYAGKCIYKNIQSFLQHFLIMSISSTLINFLGTVVYGNVPLTTYDLVWVNLVVTFLGGYVSLTKPSTDKPITLVLLVYKRSLITSKMMRNISAQVMYQVICFMVLQAIAIGLGTMGTSQNMKLMVSNSFILCQFFNLFNARELDNKNIFRGISRHKGFWIVGSIFISLQVGFVKVEEWFVHGAKLNWKLWVGCLVIGCVSWLVDWLGKCSLVIIRLCHETSQYIMAVVSFGLLAYASFFW